MHPRDFQYGTSQILPAANRSYLLGTFFRIQADADSLKYRLWPEIHRQSDFKRAHFTRSYDACSVWLGNNSYDNVLDRRRKCAPAYHSLYCDGDGELTPELAGCTEDHWMATPRLLRPLPTRPPARVHRRGCHLPSLNGGACLLPLGRVAIVKQETPTPRKRDKDRPAPVSDGRPKSNR